MGVLITKESRPISSTTKTFDTSHVLELKPETASIIGGAEFKDGVIQKWNSTSTQIIWQVNFPKPGQIEFSLRLANNRLNSGAIIRLQIGSVKSCGKTYFSGGWQQFETMTINTLTITHPGTQLVILQAVDLNNISVGLLSSLVLSGPGIEDALEVVLSPQTGFIGLKWVINNDQKFRGINWIYNSVNVSQDVRGTAYIGCSFNDGQFILLSNVQDGTKFVSFIVYSAEHGGVDTGSCTKQVIPTLIKKQKGVVSGISTECSGHYSHFKYPWQIGQTYHFLVKVDCVPFALEYTAFFYINEVNEWKKMAVYRVRYSSSQPKFGDDSLNCRVQSFCDRSARFGRQVVFGPAWCKKYGGDWTQVTNFIFICDDAIEDPRASVSVKGGNRIEMTAWGQNIKDRTKPNDEFKCQSCKLPAVLEILPE